MQRLENSVGAKGSDPGNYMTLTRYFKFMETGKTYFSPSCSQFCLLLLTRMKA